MSTHFEISNNSIHKTFAGSPSDKSSTYVTAMIHTESMIEINSILEYEATSIKDLNDFMLNLGLTYFWKVGDVSSKNRVFSRLNSLCTLVAHGQNNCTTTVKIHKLLKSKGGYALLYMIPMKDTINEIELKAFMKINHPTIIVDNDKRAPKLKIVKQNFKVNKFNSSNLGC